MQYDVQDPVKILIANVTIQPIMHSCSNLVRVTNLKELYRIPCCTLEKLNVFFLNCIFKLGTADCIIMY